jgi:predicted  nucleic acid-binding Zn-ribbon protein
VIESITPQETEPVDDELSKAQAEIQRLKDELATATAKVAESETASVAFAKKEKEASDLITELRNLKNTWKPEGRASGDGGQNKVDGIDLDRVKEIIKNSKS